MESNRITRTSFRFRLYRAPVHQGHRGAGRRSLENRRETNPLKKHTNIPLSPRPAKDLNCHSRNHTDNE